MPSWLTLKREEKRETNRTRNKINSSLASFILGGLDTGYPPIPRLFTLLDRDIKQLLHCQNFLRKTYIFICFLRLCSHNSILSFLCVANDYFFFLIRACFAYDVAFTKSILLEIIHIRIMYLIHPKT